VLADAPPAAWLALASFAVVLADARPAALLAHASSVVVLADARPAALLEPSFLAVVLADARPAALLALASAAVVLARGIFRADPYFDIVHTLVKSLELYLGSGHRCRSSIPSVGAYGRSEQKEP
jgi:hypothetical protein